MARLESDAKNGFYPTNEGTIQKIIDKTIEWPEKTVHVLDACAGEGDALAIIGNRHKAKTYGVELNRSRAKKAFTKLDTLLSADALSGVRKSNRWAGFQLLNPPYGNSTDATRLEVKFAERWGLATAVGGITMLVIGESAQTDELVTAIRAQGYRPVASYVDRDNPECDKYGQVFLILQKRLEQFKAKREKFHELFQNPEDINDIDELEDKLQIRTGIKPQMFKEITMPRWKVERAAKASTITDDLFASLKEPGLMNSSIEHPNDGQAAMLIAAGALNKEIQLDDGRNMMLKGTVTKEEKKSKVYDEKGEETGEKEAEFYRTVVYGLDIKKGEFVRFQ